NNKRLFPANNIPLSRNESALLQRLSAIWRDPQILFSNQSEQLLEEQTQAKTKSPSLSSQRIALKGMTKSLPNNVLQHGWYLWHWEGGANLIYWQQNNQQQIIGVELEPVRIKSDLISRLPNTVADSDQDDNFRLRVLDTAGQIIYQWGAFSPAKTQALQQHSLSYPLSSWSVEYYAKAYSPATLSRYSLLLTLAGFALLISALAWFLYREQTREMRLATQRVQFVSQVSHELKTPLTNIRLYAEMLEDLLDDDPQPQRYLQVITDESQRLSRLISNVLNFSRKPRLHKREFDINAVIQQSIAHFKPSFAAKSITLNLNLQAMGSLHSDPDALEQIINNLLSNAEKYAANGKQVDISSAIDQQQFTLKIRDYGKGIVRSERKRIFQPFYRINNQLTEGVSGTGIGLAIAKQQAELLGGSLELIAIDKGACFQLKLPL
ncbi:MAG TPA: HAMP domain-containing histidine kinase, partial [Leucothrix mucor]|nr:HAMP domain-containing histidine kinase [Leucothrix mucor]